jgi:hypothetical protein
MTTRLRIERLPVIAWRTLNFRTRPVIYYAEKIIAGGVVGRAIMYPDGRVVDEGGDVFASEAAWRESFKTAAHQSAEAEFN